MIDIIIYTIIISISSLVYSKLYNINRLGNNISSHIVGIYNKIFIPKYAEISTCSKRIISEYGNNKRHYPLSYISLLTYINQNLDKHTGLKCLKEIDNEGYTRTRVKKIDNNCNSDIFSLLYKANQIEPFYVYITMPKFKHLDIQCKMKKKDDDNNEKDVKIKVLEEEITIFSYKSSKKDLQDFVKACCDEYISTLKSENKDKRFYFTYDCIEDDRLFFNESDLMCNKTMDDIFFEGKEDLLEHYEYYLENPDKHFNLCLHGPPGTGKTSLIQAMLNLTKRHAMVINLNKIKTPEEFEKLFTNLEINSKDLKPRDLIYIIEEIDGYDSVKDRKTKFATEELAEKVDNIANSLNTINHITSSQNKGNIVLSANDNSYKLTNNKFNITNILNITQGINHIPGLMIFISTNHINIIDPALYRAGRMYCIELCKHSQTTILQQIKYLFKLNDSQLKDITTKYEIIENKYSGAQIEEYYTLYRRDINKFLNKFFEIKNK